MISSPAGVKLRYAARLDYKDPRRNQEVEGQEGIPQEYPGGRFRFEEKKEC
jgi:hypothetical protein